MGKLGKTNAPSWRRGPYSFTARGLTTAIKYLKIERKLKGSGASMYEYDFHMEE